MNKFFPFFLFLIPQLCFSQGVGIGNNTGGSSGSQSFAVVATNATAYVSARGLKNGLSSIFNDGLAFGPDTPGTQTSGIQEALNALPIVQQYGTNISGGKIFLAAGDFYCTNTITYSSTFPASVAVEGTSFLSTRVFYAGTTLGVVYFFSIMGGVANPNGGLQLPIQATVRNICFDSLTNSTIILLRITNSSGSLVEACNFTQWQMDTNKTEGSVVSKSLNYPAIPGVIGVNAGNVNENNFTIRNCWFSGLSGGIGFYGDHSLMENLIFSEIGLNGIGTPASMWNNTSPYSLGPAILIGAPGLDHHIKRPYFYSVNTGLMLDNPAGGACGTVYLDEPGFEGESQPVASTSPLTQQLYVIGLTAAAPGDMGTMFAIKHAPYSTINSNSLVHYSVYQDSTGAQTASNRVSVFSLGAQGTIVATNGFLVTSNTWPILTLPGGWNYLGNCGCIDWLSNAFLYKICTNNRTGNASTNLILALP